MKSGRSRKLLRKRSKDEFGDIRNLWLRDMEKYGKVANKINNMLFGTGKSKNVLRKISRGYLKPYGERGTFRVPLQVKGDVFVTE